MKGESFFKSIEDYIYPPGLYIEARVDNCTKGRKSTPSGKFDPSDQSLLFGE
jgi:hypothetical protein